jgi:ATP-dependent DNA helicase DinG
MSLHDEVLRFFGKNEWLVQRGGHHLDEQQNYALAICDWLTGASEKPLALVEGETGTGKTLGYLVPMILHWAQTGERCVIATHTINLQNQLLSGDLVLVEDFLIDSGYPLPRVQQRLGIRHFVDPERVADLCNAHDDRPELLMLFDWAQESAESGSGLIDDWKEQYGPLPEGVSDAMICLTPNSSKHVNKAFDKQVSGSRDADLVLTSHMMVLLEALSRRPILNLAESDYKHLLFDEADQLGSSAESLSNRRIQPREVASRLRHLMGKGSSALDKGLSRAIASIRDIEVEMEKRGELTTRSEMILGDTMDASQSVVQTLIHQLQETCEDISKRIKRSSLAKSSADSHAVQDAMDVLSWVCDFQKDSKAEQYGAHALAWSPKLKIPSLMYQKVSPASFVQTLWRDMGLRVAFTSATLGAMHESDDEGESSLFIPFKTEMSARPEMIAISRQFSPRSFGEASFVLADPSVPNPLRWESEFDMEFDSQWIQYTVKMIQEAALNGPTLVLCLSYQEAVILGSRIKKIQTIVHEYGHSLADCIAAFRAGQSRVLLTPAAWQGTSIRAEDGGQLIENLVVTRIPFLPPDDTAERLSIALYTRNNYRTESQAKGIFQSARRNRALIKLRQGFGRVIRKKTDVATIWVADPRFPRPGDRSRNNYFMKAIPLRFAESYQKAEMLKLHGGAIESVKPSITEDQREFLLV